ncbi:MAG: isoleucine--tRNA ligase [Planctomycetia bacterium]|nr:isoleucine--tRNA ligase [Planctomycetia bacterium]
MKTEDFVAVEHEMLAFWKEHKCFEKLVEKNRKGKIFRSLDGPITANNPMGIHHAWGRSIKDIFIKYKSLRGCHCHYINGFDSQGLWVEVEQEKELGFAGKTDIEKFGLDKFTRSCVERVKRYSGIITEQSRRLGQWMDWEHSYFTNTDANIEGIWYFLSVCNERGWIVQKYRPMPWCPRCGTSLSEHEMSGNHVQVTHRSVFALAPLKERDAYLMVWTTTPWTLTANVALAVNPDLDYALTKCEGVDKPVYLAKSALGCITGKKEVLGLVRGMDLVGLTYAPFFSELPVQDFEHTVVSWKDVAADEGTGVVHIAPGCGLEDNELGKELGLREICPIDENGVILPDYARFSGNNTHDVAPMVFDALQAQGRLYKTEDYEHSYPICWRCKHELVFRLVKEWYIATDEIRPRLIEEASKVLWKPEYIGKRMRDWLNNMGDWNISRKRFYGLPLPFYVCPDCGKITVVSSKAELKKLSDDDVDSLPELHRPWIDQIRINCPQCGAKVSRIPEVGDVWLDAGITPFSTLWYFTDREKWEKFFPVEWVCEMREQVRLWFYSLLFMSVTLTGKAPYEQVLSYGSVVKEDGSEFHKSDKSNIKFDEAADKVGADAIRYLYAAANPSFDVRFGYTLAEDARRKLLTFWNVFSFFQTYAEIDKPVCTDDLSDAHPLDKWLTNRIRKFVAIATKHYDDYNTYSVVGEFEKCLDDLSNWYVRLNRKRFWKNGGDQDKQQAYNHLYHAVKTLCQVMAPILPFTTDYIWQKLVRVYGNESAESVMLSDWPEEKSFDAENLAENELVRNLIAAGLFLRNQKHIKVKQPLPVMYVLEETRPVVEKYLAVIQQEMNVKEIAYVPAADTLMARKFAVNLKTAGRILRGDLNGVKQLVDALPWEENQKLLAQMASGSVVVPGYDKPIPAEAFWTLEQCPEHLALTQETVFVALDTTCDASLQLEGLFRELLRHVQVLRKEAGYEVVDRVLLEVDSAEETVQDLLANYGDDMEQEALARIQPLDSYDMEKKITIGGFDIILKIRRS